tara:strand:+ start:17371 stop:18084 length:714 start_codon:yes stop_codon:yes gene_type:complete
MRILSIDVGIKNLSYVLIEVNSIRPNLDWKIIEWKNVNINESYTDLNYISLEYLRWTKTKLIECLTSLINSGELTIEIPEKSNKKGLQDLIKKHLRNKKVKKATSIELQTIVKNVAKHFDSVFSPLCCDAVIIENQPCMKNPQMKSMQMIVFTYFCLLKGSNHIVKCVSASRKMQFCKSIGWIENIPKGYSETKKCSIDVVSKLFGDSPPDSWINSKKKDDLSDVIIQAFAYCDKLV